MEDDSDKESKTGVNLAGVDKLPLTQVSAGLPVFVLVCSYLVLLLRQWRVILTKKVKQE